MTDTVLLTGISGFLGGHVGLALLGAGYRVRGSVRDLSRAAKVRAALERAGADIDRLEIVALDLTRDEGWTEAAQGCRFVQHTASPFFVRMSRDRSEMVGPAVEGTRRALTAALHAGAERIVVTSSMAAIAYGHSNPEGPFTEADWTQLEGRGVTPYIESKTRAEREAWSLVEAAGDRSRLVAINPSVILGPLLDDDPGTSGEIVVRLLRGGIPAAPRLKLNVVDVRDVAALHVTAMTAPEAWGKRHIVSEGTLSLIEAGQIVGKAIPDRRGKMPRFEIPNWLLRPVALFEPSLRGNLDEIGRTRILQSNRAEALLGRQLIPAADALLSTAHTAIAHGLA